MREKEGGPRSEFRLRDMEEEHCTLRFQEPGTYTQEGGGE